MTLKKQNFEMIAGNTKSLTVTVTTSAGAIVNLTGASIRWVLRYTSGSIMKSTTDENIFVATPSSGVFQIVIDAGDTVGLSGNYAHEAEITDSNGNVSTIFTGIATIVRGLIQPEVEA
jgi:hypothetical protein